MAVRTTDVSPPLTQIAAGGLNAYPGEVAQALAALDGRIKAVVTPVDMGGGRLWVRHDGADAAAGVGEPVYEGQRWWEYTEAAVSVLFEPASSFTTSSPDDDPAFCLVGTSELAA
jgi:hypothetical protein